MELNADGVESEFFENPVELDLVWSDGDAVGFEGRDDFRGADATVEVTFFVGVGFDVDRLLTDLVSQSAQGDEALFFDVGEFLFMLFDHPFVVIVGDDREAFGEQIVVGMPWFDFDDFAGFPKVLYVLDKHQLDATIGAFGKPWELRGSFFASRFGWSCHDGYWEAGR